MEPDEAALIGALLELPKEYRAGVVKYIKGLAIMFEENEKETVAIFEAEIEAARKSQNISLK